MKYLTQRQKDIHNNWWSAVVKQICDNKITLDEALAVVPKPNYSIK